MASAAVLVLVLSLTSGLFFAGTVSAQGGSVDSRCPPGWTQFGSRCFIFYHMPKTWANAEITCKAVKGHLASIHSAAENDFIGALITRVTGQHRQTWIGASDYFKEGRWSWTDGSQSDYSKWRIAEPNGGRKEQCVEIYVDADNAWIDISCHHKTSYVCSKDM